MNIEAIRKRQNSRAQVCLKLSQKHCLKNFVDNVADAFAESAITKIATLEAMGIPFGSAVALRLGCGLIVATKCLPGENYSYDQENFEDDYSGAMKSLFLLTDTVTINDVVLIIDDYVERGRQIRAVRSMLMRQGAKIAGVRCIGVSTDFCHDDFANVCST